MAFNIKQVAAKTAANLAAGMKNRGSAKQGDEEQDDPTKATTAAVKRGGGKVASAGLSLLTSLPSLKFTLPAAGIALLLVILLGGGSGLTTQMNLIAIGMNGGTSCAPGGGLGFSNEELEEVGFGPEEISELAASCPGGGATGAGYTGATYPPAVGGITSPFGPRPGGTHWGTDISGGCGAPIYAWAGGEVIFVRPGSEELGGPVAGMVVIRHGENLYSRYGHMQGSTTTVRVGDIVSAGDQLATQWSNGQSTGCHVHFEIGGNGISRIESLEDPAGNRNPEDFFAEAGFTFPYTLDNLPPKPTGGTPVGPYTPGTAQNYASTQMAAYGWAQTEFTQCLLPLWNRESNWRVDAINPAFNPRAPATPEYQAYGIVQAAPGAKMETAGSDWRTNPETQIDWGLGYIRDRYNSASSVPGGVEGQGPCNAWRHSELYNWY